MAAGKFKLKDGEKVRLTTAAITSSTAIEAGDLVAISSGLIIKAAAASTAVAWCPNGHAANSGATCEVTVGNDFTLVGTADANFAVTDKGSACDILDTTQYLNMDASSTKVLKVGISSTAGTAGAATGVECRINLPIY